MFLIPLIFEVPFALLHLLLPLPVLSYLNNRRASEIRTINHLCVSYLLDHRAVYGVLEASKDLNAAASTHSTVIKLGYEVYPSFIALLVSTYVNCDRLNLACRVVDDFFHWNCDLLILNILVQQLMKLGKCDFAKKVFKRMANRDVVTWNSMVSGFVRNGREMEALKFFRGMLALNIEPDKFTFASIMRGCAQLGALNHALWVHSLMNEKVIELNPILSAAMIDMYSKCARIEKAKEIFLSACRNDVSVWNALLSGLAIHGLALDAISVFSQMELEKVQPDSITFIAILTACSQSGFVEEGKKYFDLMSSCYSVKPQIKHYGAIVDLFGRAGKVEEAYAIIQAMPMEPDVIIWRALLSACRIHKKSVLGEVAFKNIFRVRGEDYVLLSNIYSSQKDWGGAQSVRETMRKKGLRKKVLGRSWFEWHGVVYCFKAGDRSHPESESIYKLLERLIQRVKLEGFLPQTELVLMDVSEEEKEVNLYHHSEKLALAYGILKTSPGGEIMISKNLRICHDCHSWMKIVSKLLTRTIIVRDRIRFHRFEAGLCSCNDYW